MNAGIVILILKIAVATVTVLWLGSLIALARGNYRLHGRINLVFFALTLIALIALELVVRLISPGIFDNYFEDRQAAAAMYVHLCFSVPSAMLLFLMLFTGLKHNRKLHVAAGLFFLPHELP